jgi:hypothetical protein
MGCLLYHFAYALNLSTPAYQVGAALARQLSLLYEGLVIPRRIPRG